MEKIPEFPNFKSVELSDHSIINKFIPNFPPYSDFNFTNIWSWDIHQKMSVSQLNKNLVVLFNDYISGKPFMSFIGNNKVPETASILLDYSKKHHKTNILKLIPEEIGVILSKHGFETVYDEDSYDYIYSIADLANMNNWPRTSSLVKGIKKFVKAYPDYVIKESKVKDISKDEYLDIFKRWADNKNLNDHFESNEYKAFERFLKIDGENIRAVSLYVDNKLIGFNIYEVVSTDYAISHFSKADIKYLSSAYSILNWEEAKILKANGIKHYNWEQDLGITDIRYSKKKYKPAFFLKKFIIK